MSPIASQLGFLTLVSSALAVPFFHHGEHHRGEHHHHAGGVIPSGSGAPFGYGNGNGTGIFPRPTGTGFAPSPVGPGTASSVSAEHSTVHVTRTAQVTVTVSAVPEVPSSAEQKRWIQHRKSRASTTAAAATTQASAAPTTLVTSAAAASATTQASTAAASAASSASSAGKRGLVYNDVSLTTCFEGSSQISWAYNWDSATTGLSSAFKFIPMLWGTASTHTDSWSANAKAAIASGSTHLMSFNEPDLSTQANLSPEDAATAYKTYMMPFAGQAKLGAPAVTNGGSGMGLDWLDAFLTACTGCQIDFVSIHWYDSATNIDYFKSHVQNATNVAGGKPVYLTEFGATGTDAQVSTFLETVMPWMDGQDFMEGYSYFMVSDGLLVSGTEPSTYGSTYMS
ncbi:hypothetical protein H2203_007004 [Taxawa tesnikishii (nom. ined.)]|nr:hypothetical protein H2203_007004 [Dothideales sp. JES 119]